MVVVSVETQMSEVNSLSFRRTFTPEFSTVLVLGSKGKKQMKVTEKRVGCET